MSNNLTKTKENIKERIYEIRGVQVMLDSDLGELYGVQTKRINEAVKNNPQKFPERFSWILTDEESKTFLVENFDQKIERRGGKYKNPRVFTEQGVAMLSTILKSQTAIKVTINIMDTFVAMRKYISNNLLEQKYINNLVLENHDLIKQNSKDIKLLQESFEKFEEKKTKEDIYFHGQIYDAYSKILEIFESARNELIIIDSYADHILLDIIKRLKVKVTIITKKNNLLTDLDISKYNKQYSNLKVIFNNSFHDRYFILDKNKVYHCGTSINRIGKSTFSITLMNDNKVINSLYEEVKLCQKNQK